MINFVQYVQSYDPWLMLKDHSGYYIAFYDQFSSIFAWELIFGRTVWRLQMGKFYIIATELWPNYIVMALDECSKLHFAQYL